MDVIQLIRRDHRSIEQLFRSFERAADDVETRGRVARDIVRELSLHAAAEEQLVYPALRQAGLREEVALALEEHHAAKALLAEIEALPPSHERFVAKAKVLFANVRTHVEEEERELLPEIERALDSRERAELGEGFEIARSAAPTRPHPLAPDTPPANFVTNAVAAVGDRSRDAVRGAFEMLRVLAERTGESAYRAARLFVNRGQQRAWRAGAELRETGREGLAQIRELPGEVLGEFEERREEGRRVLAESARDAARAIERGGSRARASANARRGASPRRGAGARRANATRRKAASRKRGGAKRASTGGSHAATTH